jgi:hypothetical protein
LEAIVVTLALGAAVLGFCCLDTDAEVQPLGLDRFTHLRSGASPLVPLALSVSAVYVWAYCRMTRLRMLDCMRLGSAARVDNADAPLPNASRTPLAAAVGMSGDSDPTEVPGAVELAGLESGLQHDSAGSDMKRGEFWVFTLLGLAPVTALVLVRPPRTLEGDLMAATMWASLGTAWITTVVTLVRFHMFIVGLRELLGTLRFHPITSALGSLPDVLARPLEHQLSAGPVTMAERELLVRLQRRTSISPDDLERTLEKNSRISVRGEASTDEKVHGETATNASEDETTQLTALVQASESASRALVRYWRWEGASHDRTPSTGHVQDQERFVSAVVAHLIMRYVRQVRFFVISLGAGCVALLLGVTGYPFSTRQTLIVLVVLLTVVAAFVTARAYLALERDHVLSLVAKTPPGQVALRPELMLRLAMTFLLPLTSLALTQYPALLDGLFSWLSPLSDAFR